MALIDPNVFEMPEDPSLELMPPYRKLVDWVRAETDGLTDEQLDVDDTSPDKEWMWWSIRRQISHIAWDALVFTHRRCALLLWSVDDFADFVASQNPRPRSRVCRPASTSSPSRYPVIPPSPVFATTISV